MTRTLRTDVSFSVCGSEHDLTLIAPYTVTPGCEPTLEQPGEEPAAELGMIRLTSLDGSREYPVPGWLQDMLEGDEQLLASCLAEAADAEEYARDRAADARREAARDNRAETYLVHGLREEDLA